MSKISKKRSNKEQKGAFPEKNLKGGSDKKSSRQNVWGGPDKTSADWTKEHNFQYESVLLWEIIFGQW